MTDELKDAALQLYRVAVRIQEETSDIMLRRAIENFMDAWMLEDSALRKKQESEHP